MPTSVMLTGSGTEDPLPINVNAMCDRKLVAAAFEILTGDCHPHRFPKTSPLRRESRVGTTDSQ